MKKWWSAIREERRYFTMMAVVFVTSAVTGYFQGDSLTTFLKQAGVFEEIEKVVQSIQSQPTFLNAFVSIFLNNLFATMMIILLGALFFGIYPFSAMLMNGMLLGTTLYVASHDSGQNPWPSLSSRSCPMVLWNCRHCLWLPVWGFIWEWQC